MSAARRFDRLVKCYPPSWQARYGDELTALLEDINSDASLSIGKRLSVVRGGLVERVRASGFSREADSAAQVRAGALLVLCAWAAFMVAGSAFAKYLEHWDLATPASARWLPADAVTAVTCAAAVAVGLVALGALTLVRPVARAVRAHGWGRLGRATALAALLVATALAATGGLVLLAHSQTGAERNGGSVLYTAAGGIWACIVLSALFASTRAAVVAAGRVELRGALRALESICALGVFLCMAVVLAGTVTWWAVVAERAPGFLGTSLGPLGTWGSVAPPAMIGITALMLVALVAAGAGASRIVGARHGVGADG